MSPATRFVSGPLKHVARSVRRTPGLRENANIFVLHSSFSQSYQYQQHLLNQQQSNAVNFVNPLNKLYCALLSGLPNEMEFGLSVASTLATSQHVDWIADYKFVEVLLDCLKLYACVCEVQAAEPLDAALPTCSSSPVSETGAATDCSSRNGEQCNTPPASSFPKPNLVSPPKRCSCLPNFWSKLCNDSSVMECALDEQSDSPDCGSHTHHDMYTQDSIYRRVARIADLIRTLSLTIETSFGTDVTVPPSLLKFVSLLLSANDALFNSTGLDILSNLAAHTAVTRDEDDEYSTLQKHVYQKCVSHIIRSNDINCLNRSLEVITKLVTTSNDEITVLVTTLFDEEVSPLFSGVPRVLTLHVLYCSSTEGSSNYLRVSTTCH